MSYRHSKEAAREAKKTLAGQLRDVDGVTSVGLGVTEDRDDYAVVVTVRDADSGVGIPRHVEGVPVRVSVSGPISGY